MASTTDSNTTNIHTADDLSPTTTHDFATSPPERSSSSPTIPRGWSLQQPHPNKLTLGPMLDLPPEGPTGTSLMTAIAKEKPWYKFRVGSTSKRRRWVIGTRKTRDGSSNDLSVRTTAEGRDVKKGVKLCSCKFDEERTTCAIVGVNGNGGEMMHTIDHEYRPRSRYRVRAMDNPGAKVEEQYGDLYWQTLGPSQTVLELVNDEEGGRRIALFVYTSDPAQQMDPESGRRRPLRPQEVGEVWITDVRDGWAKNLERVALTVTCVVEMRWNRKR